MHALWTWHDVYVEMLMYEMYKFNIRGFQKHAMQTFYSEHRAGRKAVLKGQNLHKTPQPQVWLYK